MNQWGWGTFLLTRRGQMQKACFCEFDDRDTILKQVQRFRWFVYMMRAYELRMEL